MRIVKLVQRSDEWHKWRKSGIGSSDIAAIVGKSPWSTPYQVWEKLMGLRNQSEVNPAMQRGIDYEDEARTYIGDDTLRPECIEHSHYDYFHASLDGINDKYFVEIKVPSQKNFASYEHEIPEYYHIQVQWQFLVSGFQRCLFVAYSPELKKAYIRPVFPDQEMMDELERKASKFWDDYQKGISPPIQENDIFEMSGPELKELCMNYHKWHGIKTTAEKECSKAKEQILKFGTGHNFRSYGVRCIKMSPKTTYDMDAMRRDGIDVDKYKKVSEKESFMLRVEGSD